LVLLGKAVLGVGTTHVGSSPLHQQLVLSTKLVKISTEFLSLKIPLWSKPMRIQPSQVKLIEYVGKEAIVISTQSATPKGRDRINRMRNDLLMVDSTRLLDIIEHGSNL